MFQASTSFAFFIAAVEGRNRSLADDYGIEGTYTVMVPIVLFGLCTMADFFLDTLPSQLLPAGGFMVRLKEFAQKDNGVSNIGIAVVIPVIILGMVSFTGALWPIQTIDHVLVAGVFSAVIFIVSGVAQITRFIGKAGERASGSPNNKEFYARTRTSLRKIVTGTMSEAVAEYTGYIARSLDDGWFV